MIIRQMTLEQLQEKILKNKKYKQLIEAFHEKKLYNLKLEDFKEEILSLHQARTVRTLVKFCEDKEGRMVDEVIRANLTDQGQRSRLTTIMIGCMRASNALTKALGVFKDYALVRYDPYLSKIKTKGERSTFLDTVLADMQTYINDCELVIALAKQVIGDIDQAGWTLSRTIEALKLNQSPERKI